MTRTLCILRHADAGEFVQAGKDHERPLTKAGIGQCRQAAAFLERNELLPDLVVASSAKRTRETAVIIQEIMGLPPNVVRFDDRLYSATSNTLLAVLREAPDAVRTQFLVGHNPSVSELAFFLGAGGSGLEKAEVIVIDLEREHWNEVGENCGKKRLGFRPQS